MLSILKNLNIKCNLMKTLQTEAFHALRVSLNEHARDKLSFIK